MTFFPLLMLSLGMVAEGFVLFYRAGIAVDTFLKNHPRLKLGLIIGGAFLLLLSVIISMPEMGSLADFFEAGPDFTLDDTLAVMVILPPFFLLIVLGLFYAKILPPLRRESLISVLLLVWYVLLRQGRLHNMGAGWISLLAAVNISILVLLLRPKRLPWWLRFTLYLVFLSLLMYLAVDGFPYQTLDAMHISALEAFLFGMVGTYLVFHGFFLMRMFIISFSLWRWRNRRLAEALSDIQFPDTTPVRASNCILLGAQLVLLSGSLLFAPDMDMGILAFALVVFPQLIGRKAAANNLSGKCSQNT